MTATHSNTEPHLSLKQVNDLFNNVPMSKFGELVEAAILTCKHPQRVRQEITSADWSDPMWRFFVIDLLAKNRAKFSALHLD